MSEPDKKAFEDQWLQTWEPTPEVEAIASQILEILDDPTLSEQEQFDKIYAVIKWAVEQEIRQAIDPTPQLEPETEPETEPEITIYQLSRVLLENEPTD